MCFRVNHFNFNPAINKIFYSFFLDLGGLSLIWAFLQETKAQKQTLRLLLREFWYACAGT